MTAHLPEVVRRYFPEIQAECVRLSPTLWRSSDGTGPIVRVVGPDDTYPEEMAGHRNLFRGLANFVDVVPYTLVSGDRDHLIIAEFVDGTRLRRADRTTATRWVDFTYAGFLRYWESALNDKGNYLLDLGLEQVLVGTTRLDPICRPYVVDVGPDGGRFSTHPTMFQTVQFLHIAQLFAIEVSDVRDELRVALPMTDEAIGIFIKAARKNLPFWSRPLVNWVVRAFQGKTHRAQPLLRLLFFLKRRGLPIPENQKVDPTLASAGLRVRVPT